MRPSSPWLVAVLVILALVVPAPREALAQTVLVPATVLAAQSPPPSPEDSPPPPPCESDCFVLTQLVLRGAVDGAMAFELRGTVRAREEQKVPLFGPPGQVRLDDVTLDGAPAALAFDGDHYVLFHGRGAFVLRGRMTLGADQILSVPGPLVALDAHLTKGKLVEGHALSGVSAAVLHFDPMTEASARARKAPPVFRLSRALRFGSETAFTYRLVTSQETDAGEVRLPLRNGEKISEVQGGAQGSAFRVEDDTLVVPVSGHEPELTITGTLAATKGAREASPDARSAYEWWLVESDPEHRVSLDGDGKLVEPSQSPIPPTMPTARVVLLQRGEHMQIATESLARGDVLAAAIREQRRFVAVTGTGEIISDETASLDDVGLDHLDVTPPGRATYVSVDAVARRLLHPAAGSRDVVLPVWPGMRRLRLQALGETRLTPFLGVLSLPTTSYPVATSAVDLTVGLPEDIRPVAVIGGERLLHAFHVGDALAPAIGIATAIFVFATRRTRVLGAAVMAGLWFVSHEGFVVIAAALAAAGGIFVVSRLLRGTRLVFAVGAVVLAALVGGRVAIAPATADEVHEMNASDPKLPEPESVTPSSVTPQEGAALPVSLAFPSSDRYVRTTRQLVTRERPFVPRIVYVTSTLVAGMHGVWFLLAALLVFEHRSVLLVLKRRIVARLTRPRPTGEAPSDVAALPPF